VQSAVFSVMETTPPITRVVRSTRTCNGKPTPSPPQTVYSSRPHSANLTHPARSILRPNHLKNSSSYANPCACPTCQPTPTIIQRYLEPQSPDEKPLRTNGNHDKPPHHYPYNAQIMAIFLQLALWNANGLHHHAEEPK
jgi:hypothetical protein